MKAKRVKKLDRERPLAENAARIVRVRLAEMRSFAPKALDAGNAREQHDMRIAAKRLRYVLETTDFCFGEPARAARRAARDLQGLLGDIHDCDVMLPRVEEHVAELRESDAEAVRRRAGDAPDLDGVLAGHAPNRVAYRGLEVLAVYLRARRKLLFDRFSERWAEQEQEKTWEALDGAVARVLADAKERRKAARRAEAAERELAAAEHRRREAHERAQEAAAELAATERVARGGAAGRRRPPREAESAAPDRVPPPAPPEPVRRDGEPLDQEFEPGRAPDFEAGKADVGERTV